LMRRVLQEGTLDSDAPEDGASRWRTKRRGSVGGRARTGDLYGCGGAPCAIPRAAQVMAGGRDYGLCHRSWAGTGAC
jgi:hypothetical protein